MRRSLVTGGAGFIGSHVATALVERGDFVRVFDNLSTGDLGNLAHLTGRYELVRGDINDPRAAAAAVDGIECVFHHAALPSVQLSVEDPIASHRECGTGVVTMLEAARTAGVRRFVYAGSSSVYGDQPTSSKREIDLPAPLSPYAAAKLTGELYCQAFHHTFGLETVRIRYFNVFGPRQNPDSPYSAVIPRFITAILSGKRPIIYGDGMQSRDFTYVGNVVRGNLLAAEADGVAGRVYNVANGRSTSLLELLNCLARLLEMEVQPIHEPARVGDVRESLADITAARRELGYEPEIELEEGLRRSIDYYRQVVGK